MDSNTTTLPKKCRLLYNQFTRRIHKTIIIILACSINLLIWFLGLSTIWQFVNNGTETYLWIDCNKFGLVVSALRTILKDCFNGDILESLAKTHGLVGGIHGPLLTVCNVYIRSAQVVSDFSSFSEIKRIRVSLAVRWPYKIELLIKLGEHPFSNYVS